MHDAGDLVTLADLQEGLPVGDVGLLDEDPPAKASGTAAARRWTSTHDSPRSSMARVVCDPMKPRPPVIRIISAAPVFPALPPSPAPGLAVREIDRQYH
jgi:hypothetical protein